MGQGFNAGKVALEQRRSLIHNINLADLRFD